jgi:hypothetical protein
VLVKRSIIAEATMVSSLSQKAIINLLYVLITDLTTDMALLMPLPHMLKELIRTKESFMAELDYQLAITTSKWQLTSHIGCGASQPLTISISFSPLG